MVDAGVGAARAKSGARRQGQRLRGTKGYQVLVRTGLVCFGVVHLLIAWLALQVAWGGGGNAEVASERWCVTHNEFDYANGG